MKNPVNQIHKKMLEEFESKRKYNKRMIEEDVSWRKVPFEIKKIFYICTNYNFNYVNCFSR